ncbi:lipoyltransferase and lipoate-protein ligase [Colletotrichum karsti]|uniref:Putative lipoate-protein ligase A n=1 Tax=Colletotrichum karsti TaxID=1095194 RepID=A0A9P6I076_9PEZI|nr:lipoyltransferase and lipoate-protein ligase [Colletotrichum karsti]KAF9874557.1 lipoyltransferase and lipoate-protein ligase [Colletotrichum karsti]
MLAIRPLPRTLSCLRPPTHTRFFSALAANPSSKTQVYISNSRSPYINLSIEHHLLQTTPSDSTILFLYTNRPSIVIGRNQNPWLEVNLPLLQSLDRTPDAVDLVRRRSGGGTVFHDEGNVNYSVICPPANFDRDTHAEMVVRALRRLGVPDVAVNCRHDIIMTSPSSTPVPTSSCTGKPLANAENTYKISGSAYKLTRLRSLHHGTCLLSSPNLPRIGSFLRSPAEPFIKARGVESVRSKIRNVGVEDTKRFEKAVVEEFGRMYGAFDVEAELGEEDAGRVEKVQKGLRELQSREWIYGQTPLFTFSTHPSEDDTRERPELPAKFKLAFEARHGLIQKFALEGLSSAQPQTLSESMLNAQIWELGDWTRHLRDGGLGQTDASVIGEWMNSLLGKTQA